MVRPSYLREKQRQKGVRRETAESFGECKRKGKINKTNEHNQH